MITGTSKQTEQQYREKTIDSSSSLKDFSLDRKLYYRRYILHEKVEEKENQAIKMGQIVETLLLEPELFDKKFYLSACASAPSALMMDFVEALVSCTMEATNEDGICMREFKDISQDAFDKSGFSGKGNGSYEAVIKKFEGSDAEIYFNELLSVKTNNLIVVTAQDIANAEKIVEELKTNFVTGKIINQTSDATHEVYNQLQVEGFEIEGLSFKSMIDKVIVNHVTKTIYSFDLKCTWSVEQFYREYFLHRRSYLQAYVYYKAIEHFRNEHFPDYSIEPLQFIVCDSINYYNPLIYKLSLSDLQDAYDGFEYKNYEYPGVAFIINELKWAQDNNLWNISKDAYESNGIVNLKK